MKKYEQLDISGDAGLRIWGENLEELFANAAEGMSELITDLPGIEETEGKEVFLSSERNEDLLVKWLNEIIFLFDTYGFIGKRFDVSLKNYTLRANISGGIYNPATNESRLLVKAATYHGLSLKKDNSHWEAVVIFDI
ncbi:MAG: archease [Nitrospirae bacterium]|nr:archease [Nitrospirota bacterium]